ncbi:hypothetical protein [[Eubacterium] cellulosolvens]
MRELDEKDWLKIFDYGVISVMTSYQIQPKDGFRCAWYPESFKQNCPPEKKADMCHRYIDLKIRGFDDAWIGRMLFNLPYVKHYNIPNKK